MTDTQCLNWLAGLTCGLGLVFCAVIVVAACRISSRISRREAGLMLCGHHVDNIRSTGDGWHWCAACEEEAE